MTNQRSQINPRAGQWITLEEMRVEVAAQQQYQRLHDQYMQDQEQLGQLPAFDPSTSPQFHVNDYHELQPPMASEPQVRQPVMAYQGQTVSPVEPYNHVVAPQPQRAARPRWISATSTGAHRSTIRRRQRVVYRPRPTDLERMTQLTRRAASQAAMQQVEYGHVSVAASDEHFAHDATVNAFSPTQHGHAQDVDAEGEDDDDYVPVEDNLMPTIERQGVPVVDTANDFGTTPDAGWESWINDPGSAVQDISRPKRV